MVFQSKKGYYQLLEDFKNAFNKEIFEEYYIEECLDKYPYVVGDLSDGKLRLKGFNNDPKSPSFIKNLSKYLENSCVFEAPYYVLKRVSSDKEMESLKDMKAKITPSVSHLSLEKENFDKETLVLETSTKQKPKIVLDLARINKVPLGSLPKDLKEEQGQEEKTVTTISTSEGFVPKERPRNNNRRPNRKNNFNKKEA